MSKEKTLGKARLLDHWIIPDNAGAPIGCLATTYTFQADFFEEECLSRFLGMESNAAEDGPVYLVEREEKLNSIDCASVWVDQAHVKQLRNLRWDLIPFRLRQGILHAKITVLRWSRHLRVLVGSANLTEEGFRKNQEVLAVLDLNETKIQDKLTIISILNSLLNWINENEWASSGVNQRSVLFIQESVGFANSLPDIELNLRYLDYLSFPIIVQPGRPSFLEQVSNIWQKQFGNVGPSYTNVISPFFDPPGTTNIPAQKTWEIMRKKGIAELSITTSGEWDIDKNPHRIHAPESLLLSKPSGRTDVKMHFGIINPLSEQDKANRQLHSKCYWFTNDQDEVIYIVGSSNFTSRGLGLTTGSNVEANIAIVTDRKRHSDTIKLLEASWTDGEVINPDKIKWTPQSELEVEDSDKEPSLHPFFQTATIRKEKVLFLELTFQNIPAPVDFFIRTPKDQLILDYDTWISTGQTSIIRYDIDEENLPAYLLVFWNDITMPACMPVNITDQTCLPPPEELRNLPLDVLAELITSAKPIHIILKKYLKGKSKKGNIIDTIIDPLKRFDSSAFLLQRTRKYSLAINQIQSRLEQPFGTASSLDWRLYGPVGVRATVEAIVREAHNKSEAVFFLSEIWKRLGLIKLKQVNGALPISIVRKQLSKFREQLKEKIIELLTESDNIQINNYSQKLLQQV